MWIIWPFKKKNFGLAWTVCADFRRFVDPSIGKFIIQDETRLPHAKDDIFDSMCILLMTETDSSILEAVKASAFELAFFQKDVGDRPLYPLGIERDAFESGEDDRPDSMRFRPSDPTGKERYDRFKRLRDADWQRMRATMVRVQRKAAS